VFSTIMIFNIVNSAFFYRTSVNLPVVVGAILGICGIAIIFWPQLATLDFSSGTMIGMLLGLAGAGSASWGNMLSARNQKNHLPVMESNAYAMAYGGLFTLIVAVVKGVPMTFDWSVSYVGSLFYLSFLGSIVAFGCYLTLLGRIGASKAAYALLLTPVVALVISTIFEDFSWSFSACVGVGFIFLGNVLVLIKKSQRKIISHAALEQSLKDAA
jgi:drug/metabolite transporter (DMT)-like permease